MRTSFALTSDPIWICNVIGVNVFQYLTKENRTYVLYPEEC